MTTFLSYGEVAADRQAEIIRCLGKPEAEEAPDVEKVVEAVMRRMSQAQIMPPKGDEGGF